MKEPTAELKLTPENFLETQFEALIKSTPKEISENFPRMIAGLVNKHKKHG